MAKKESDDECEVIGYIILAGVIISGPLCLIDAIIFTTTGSSIWYRMYGPDEFTAISGGLYNIWFMFIWGGIITAIELVFVISLLFIRNKNLGYLVFYILGGTPVYFISLLIGSFIISVYVTIGYYVVGSCVVITRYIITKESFPFRKFIKRRSFFNKSGRRTVAKYKEKLEEILSNQDAPTIFPTQKSSELPSFETFVRSAKKLRKDGKEFYKKKEYQKAVESWQTALKRYESGLAKKINKTQKEQLEINIPIIIQDIVNCLLEKANHHKKSGERHLSKHKLQEAEKEMKIAVQDFTQVKTMIKSHKLSQIEISLIDENLKYLDINLKKVDIETIIEQNERIAQDAENLKKDNLTDAIKRISEVLTKYLEMKNKYKKEKDLTALMKKVDEKIIQARKMQETYHQSFDKLIGITPVTSPVSLDIPRSEKAIFTDSELVTASKRSVDIKREYDFVSGEVRFRIALRNLMERTITNIKINIDIPPSLRWVIHEPRYPKKGDTIEIPKLGAQEKTSLAIYFAPISCLEGQINATITYFDSYNNPHALIMEPKTVAITCPIFFTSQTANLARVRNLYEQFSFRHTKLYPIINKSKIYHLFEIFIKILNEFDIRMVLREFNKDTNEGEAWFYGETKVKKNRLVVYVSIGKNFELILLEVGGNTQEQVTSFLAEINYRIKEGVLKENIFDNTLIYNDIKTSILSYLCPYCGDEVLEETVRKFINGDSFECRYCNIAISTKELNILDR